MKTSICLCTWEKTHHITKVLQNLAATCTGEYEIVVVDDASTNPEVETLILHFKGLFEKVGIPFIYHRNEKNSKHAASQNKAWDLATGDILYHVEDDILAVPVGWNQTMAKFLQDHPEVGQVTPQGTGRGEWIPRESATGPYNEFAWALGGLFAVRKEVYQKIGGWDTALVHQVEPDFNLRVRMAGWRLAEVPGVQMIHLGEGEQSETFRRQAQIIVGVHTMLMKWNKRFVGFWDYDSVWSMSWDDFFPNQMFRRQLAAYFAGEAKKLEERYRGLGELKDDPHYANAVPEDVRKFHQQLSAMRLNPEKRPFKFYSHWGAYELINIVRPQGREREDELIQLMKNNHVFGDVRRVENQLRDLAKRMNYNLTEEELKQISATVPLDYEWVGVPKYA